MAASLRKLRKMALLILASTMKCGQASALTNRIAFSLTRRTPRYINHATTEPKPLRRLFTYSGIFVQLRSSTTDETPLITAKRVSMEKKQTRKQYLEMDRQRNLRVKTLISSQAQQELYAIKVSVDSSIRDELHMNGREKRGRMFIPLQSEGCQSYKGLKQELHSFFRSLKKSTYRLSAALPEITQGEGDDIPQVVAPQFTEEQDSDNSAYWPLASDVAVAQSFGKAMEYFNSCELTISEVLKRPTLILHVSRNPDYIKPPTPPYLQDMPDPKTTSTMTMISFYSFPPQGIKNPEEFAMELKKLWKPFDVLGRVYVATEGVNAQMSVPTNVFDNFHQCCCNIKELGEYMENGINVDPLPIPIAEFPTAGEDGLSPPFKNLHIRVRSQIVSDGLLEKTLDFQSAGYDMPPLEWHEKLQKLKEAKDIGDPNHDLPIVLDCRNQYETGVGRFEAAEPVNTENFRETWDVLHDRLKDVPKDAPIMTYCTGGIRCVKVGAYLTQEMGFTNVSRLAGGIIAYDRALQNESESMFKGTNYVFDGRVGRKITDDELGTCLTCGGNTSLLSNCANPNCHRRMVQCEKCRTSYEGTCSDACKGRVINIMSRNSETYRLESRNQEEMIRPPLKSLEEYSQAYSTNAPSLFNTLIENTQRYIPSGSHMVSGEAQGRLLTMLSSISQEGRILEVGTFTGYATLCFIQGSALASQRFGSFAGGPFVMSLERDVRALQVAAAHIDIASKYGFGESAADVAKSLPDNRK